MWNLKEKMEIKIPLILGVAIFLTLYLPTMNRPFHFEELRVTSHFSSAPPSNNFVMSQDTISGNKLSTYWYDYIKLHPPGLVGFYYIWRKITFSEEEVIMRIPLLVLSIFAFLSIFNLLKIYIDEKEAALVTLLSSFLTFWYGMGSLIVPETFALLLSVLSTSLFAQSLKEKKVKNSLLLINLLGSTVSYIFLILVAIQTILIFFSKTAQIQRKKLATIILSSYLLCNGIHYYLIPNNNHSNPLTFFLPKADPSMGFKLMHLIFSGRAEN